MLVVLAVFLSMLISGFASMAGVIVFLMNLGLKYHDNYEYYGAIWLNGYPALFLMCLAGAIGFAAPGVICWRLSDRKVRFSVRTALLITTFVAILVKIAAVSL